MCSMPMSCRCALSGQNLPESRSCEWGISQGYVPLPSIIYGLNYFATSADFFVVSDDRKAKEVIAHVTNKGKYPFCYQKIRADATDPFLRQHLWQDNGLMCCHCRGLAEKIYQIFSIPLVTMVFVRTGSGIPPLIALPHRYSRISSDERALLSAYLAHQEFL